MKRLPAVIVAALAVTVMTVAPAVAHIKPHAGAHAAPWRWKTVDGGTQQVAGGTQVVGAVDLHAATTHDRQLLTLPAFGNRTGTVTLKVLTSGKLVRIDGVGISRT